MMEAMSGSVTAAGIYLKVADRTNKEGRDRSMEKEKRKRKTERERWPCNERLERERESERHQLNKGPGVQGGRGGGGDN